MQFGARQPTTSTMRTARVLYLGLFAGALGAIVMYDARPGINWFIWVTVVVAGLVLYRQPDRPTIRAMTLPLCFTVVLAAGAAVTTAPLLLFGIFVIAASLLALALLLARDPVDAADYGALEIITAPVRALASTLAGIGTALFATIESAGTARRRPALRGTLIAAPIVLVFALLFASADPLLARGRDFIHDAITSWDSLPRVVFGLMLALFVVGAYTASLPRDARKTFTLPVAHNLLGITEWRIILGSVATVSWLFVVLQISYLFRIAPSVAGSGVTFAEYARRGFGELALAATVAALLIVAAQQHAPSPTPIVTNRRLVAPSLLLLSAVVCILVSAFHRVSLYEDAYGFTTARVYAQAYMGLILAILIAVGWRVLRTFDVRALAREVMTLSLITLTAVVYWNGDAWVASANLDRFGRTGKIDVPYLLRGLSPDAYPALVDGLARMPVAAQERAQLGAGLTREYLRRPYLRDGSHWYEWNLRRARARNALAGPGPSSSVPASF